MRANDTHRKRQLPPPRVDPKLLDALRQSGGRRVSLPDDSTMKEAIDAPLDRNERKRLEQRLRESEERYRLLVENSTDIILRLTPDASLLYISPTCHALLGYDPDEVVGRSVYDVVQPIDVEHVRQTHAAVLNSTDIHTATFRVQRKNGSDVWLEATSRSIRNAETGAVQEVLTVARDITKRKRTEEALAAERERLAVTLRSTGDGVIATDPQGEIVLINEVAQMLTGWTPETAVGKPLSEVLAHFGGHAVNETLNRCADGLPHDMMVEGLPLRIFEMRTKPITEGPEAGGQLLLVRNVTVEREVQRTLEQQGRLAAVGQLAAGIAHDFNNILTVVIGIAERL